MKQNKYPYKYDDEYTSKVTKICKCGHSIAIYNKDGKEICNHCGRLVFLTKNMNLNIKCKGDVVMQPLPRKLNNFLDDLLKEFY